MGCTDPDQIHSRSDLAAGLRALQTRADLSLRDIAAASKTLVAQADKESRSGFVRLPHQTVSDFQNSGRLDENQLRTFLAVCHVSRNDVPAWMRARDRVGSATRAGATGDKVEGAASPRAGWAEGGSAVSEPTEERRRAADPRQSGPDDPVTDLSAVRDGDGRRRPSTRSVVIAAGGAVS